MGGIHVASRATTGWSYKAVGSKLTLPSASDIAGIPNGSNGKGSVVPEFFHGMYNGSIGFDAGMLYANGAYRLFVNSLQDGWAEDNTTFTATGSVTMNTSFVTSGSNKYVRIEIVGKRTCDFWVSNTVYNTLNGSAQIIRELNIATNPSGSTTVLPKAAYFKNAKFTESTMTSASGTYVSMNNSNSELRAISPDNDPKNAANYSTYCDSKRSTSTSGNFAQETASCTFDKTQYPI